MGMAASEDEELAGVLKKEGTSKRRMR